MIEDAGSPERVGGSLSAEVRLKTICGRSSVEAAPPLAFVKAEKRSISGLGLDSPLGQKAVQIISRVTNQAAEPDEGRSRPSRPQHLKVLGSASKISSRLTRRHPTLRWQLVRLIAEGLLDRFRDDSAKFHRPLPPAAARDRSQKPDLANAQLQPFSVLGLVAFPGRSETS